MTPTIQVDYQTCCAQFSWPELTTNEELAFKEVYSNVRDESIAMATSRALSSIQAVDALIPNLSAIYNREWSRIEAMQVIAEEIDRKHQRQTPTLVRNASAAEKIVLAIFKRSIEAARNDLNAEELDTGTLLFGMPEAKSLLAGQIQGDAFREKENILQKLKQMRDNYPTDTSSMPLQQQQLLLQVDRQIAHLESTLPLMAQLREQSAISEPSEEIGSAD
ncbi:MAG: hypothetical protein K0S07_1176 [Chlamydiales bacterium]|nr:hypothetical protein [Chlamydiales bacterium]